MLINQFNGGLNTRQAPQMLALNQAVVYDNIDSYVGTLSPVKQPLARADLPVNQYPTWFEAGNRWVNSFTGVYVPRVELNKKLYAATSTGLVVTDDVTGLSRDGGVPAPVNAPGATVVPGPGRVGGAKLTAEASLSITALPVGSYSYVLLNKNILGYSAGLAVRLDVSGTSTVSDPNYYWAPNDIVTVKDYEQTVGPSVAAYQTVTISNVAAVIDPTYGLDVYRLYNGKHYKVGTIDSISDTLVDDTLDISANDELDASEFTGLKGTYQYVITRVNTAGIESAPSPVSVEANTLDGGAITVSYTPDLAFAGTTRIYRVGGSLTAFSLVTELSAASSGFSDTLSDTEIDGRILTSQENTLAPAAMTSLITAYGMLFGAAGTSLRYTNPGEPEYWPEAYSIPFPTAITGLAAVSNGILVFTSSSTFIVTGSGPLTLSVQLLRGDQGCLDPKSVQSYLGNAIWASASGLCVSSGSSVELITRSLLGFPDFGIIKSSALHDEVYYIAYNDNKVLAADFSFGSLMFKNFTFGFNSVSFFQDRKKLYLFLDGESYEAFASAEPAQFTYKSPRFIEGRATENKTYKKLYFYVKGQVDIEVFINDTLVATKSTVPTFEDVVELLVPQQLQRGFFIQLAITGTGEVYEFEYQAVGRERG